MSGFLTTLLRKERGVAQSVKPRGLGVFEQPTAYITEASSPWESSPFDAAADHDAESAVEPDGDAASRPSSRMSGPEDPPVSRRRADSTRVAQRSGIDRPADEPLSIAKRHAATGERHFRTRKAPAENSPNAAPASERGDGASPRPADSVTIAARRPAGVPASKPEGQLPRRASNPTPGETSSRATRRPARRTDTDRPADRAERPPMPAVSESQSEARTPVASVPSTETPLVNLAEMSGDAPLPAFPWRQAATAGRRRESADARARPVVHVSIGRIEIRARTEPAPPPATMPKAKPYRPTVTLDEYLKKRGDGR